MPREPEWWYRPAGPAACLLQPLGSIYGVVAGNRLARRGAYRSRLPVICVGNFTAGGSGKTPFTAMLVQRLMERGARPAVLTRGYGGSMIGPHWVDLARDAAGDVGDEPLLLAAIAPTLVARDRRAGAHAIEDAGEANVIVMDDGLQNSALVKDLNIAIVDGARGIGNGFVIPAGPLRAPLAVQGPLAGLVVFNGTAKAGLAQQLARSCAAPQITAQLLPSEDVGWLKGERVVAFAGIGHPARFFQMLAELGAVLSEAVAFPDHARFSDADADRLMGLARRHQARLITTSKDHVRLHGTVRLEALAAATATLPVHMTLPDADMDLLSTLLDAVLPPA